MTKPMPVAEVATAEVFLEGNRIARRFRPSRRLSRLGESLAGARDAVLEPARVAFWGAVCLLPYLTTRDEAKKAALLSRLLRRHGPL